MDQSTATAPPRRRTGWWLVNFPTLVVLFLSVGAFLLAHQFDLYEAIYVTSRAHENWDLDEIIVALAISAVALATIANIRLGQLRREIAQRQIAQTSLDAHARWFQVLVERSQDAITLLDQAGLVIYDSPAAPSLLGYQPGELIGHNALALVHPDDLPAVQSAFQQLATQPDGGAALIFRLKHHDGAWRWIDANLRNLLAEPSVGAIVVNYRDITARYEAETALAESQQRLLALIENAPDGITLVNAAGRFEYISPSTERILGYRPADLPNYTPVELTHPDDQLRMVRLARRLRSEPGAPVTARYRFRHRDGSWRWLESTISNLLDDPSVRALVFNYRDVTERYQHERELEALAKLHTVLRQPQTRSERLAAALNLVMEIFQAAGAWIRLRDESQAPLTLVAAQGSAAPVPEPAFGPSLSAQVIDTVQALVVPDASAEARMGATQRLGDAQSLLCVPLVAYGSPIGALWAARRWLFEPAEVLMFTSLAEIVANAIAQDTQFERAEAAIRRLEALRAIDQAINDSLDLRLTLLVLVRQVTLQLGVDAADVLLFDEGQQVLSYAAGQGFRTQAIAQTRQPLGRGHGWQAVRERDVIIIPDLPAARQEFLRWELLRDEGFESYVSVALMVKGRVVGVLECFHRTRLAPTTEWLSFFTAVAGQAAIAIEQHRLFAELQQSHTDLKHAYDSTIEGWSRALDLRDQETEGHSQRVTALSLRLAQAMQIPPDEMLHLRRGALLHDIGKVGVPDHILLKPGPLTDAEQAIMRRHPQMAYDLLAPIAYLRPALAIPYAHHEKWDGTGYPNQLKGVDIPLSARIFAVVDVWDALTSNRPYRLAYPPQVARQYIQEQAGQHFDPEVVAAFLTLLSAEGDQPRSEREIAAGPPLAN